MLTSNVGRNMARAAVAYPCYQPVTGMSVIGGLPLGMTRSVTGVGLRHGHDAPALLQAAHPTA